MSKKISVLPFIILFSALLFSKVEANQERVGLLTEIDKVNQLNKTLMLDRDTVKTVNQSLQEEVRRLENSAGELLQQLEVQEEEKRQKEEEVTSPFSNLELDLLYRLVECEAGAEPMEGKIAVANVVLNRMRSERFPDTVTEVIYQPYQFQPVATGFIDHVEVSEDSILAVDKAVNGVKVVSEDVVFFWAKWLDKSHDIWSACPITTTIGVHHFATVWND